MNPSMLLRLFGTFSLVLSFALTSCTVDQNTAQNATQSGGAAKKKESETGPSLAEKRQKAREEREKAREVALAEKKKAEAEKKRELAEAKKKEEAEKAALALRMAKKEEERRAKEAKRKADLLAKREKDRLEREASYAARQRAVESGEIRARNREIQAAAQRNGAGFFSRMAVSTPSKYKSKGHDVVVNHRLLSSLSPSNAKIEVSLREQKARVYKMTGGQRQLVIETRVSTGKSGYSTPTGTYRISEKKVEKRSTLYGTWKNSSGQTIPSNGEVGSPPPGATTFVGAEMPYWMRINGGIGMHIGYVPNGPASHGCIRVPSAVQPLIYSKVGVGTTVSVIN